MQPGQQGNIDLRACLSAEPENKHKKSPALKLENELRKKGINMNVRGFQHKIQANQLYEDTMDGRQQNAQLVDTFSAVLQTDVNYNSNNLLIRGSKN